MRLCWCELFARKVPLGVPGGGWPASTGRRSEVNRPNSALDREISGAVASSPRPSLPSDRCTSYCSPCFRAYGRLLLAGQRPSTGRSARDVRERAVSDPPDSQPKVASDRSVSVCRHLRNGTNRTFPQWPPGVRSGSSADRRERPTPTNFGCRCCVCGGPRSRTAPPARLQRSGYASCRRGSAAMKATRWLLQSAGRLRQRFYARSPAGTSHRSASSNTPCTSSASAAAGIAPASSSVLSFSARPVTMRSP